MIQFWYEHAKIKKLEKKKSWRLYYKFGKLVINTLYPTIAMKKITGGLDTNSKIIVSLTSFPDRIHSVWLTIASLMNQTLKPQKIILWLAEEQFPNHIVPKKLGLLEQYGLEVRFCKDLKPHKKYYYAAQEYRDEFIVTADDDIFYPENHLEKLWKGHERYGDSIICLAFRNILMDHYDHFLPYTEWNNNLIGCNPSMSLLAIGANGVLYPPYSLPDDTFDIDYIMNNNVLFTDDLWLKCMEIKNQKDVFFADTICMAYFNNIKTIKNGLWRENAESIHRNDIVWNELMSKFPDIKKTLKKLCKIE